MRLSFVLSNVVTLCLAGCAGSSRSVGGGGGAGGSAAAITAALLERLSVAEALWKGHAADQCRSYHYSRYYSSYFGTAQVVDVNIADGKPVGRRMWNVSRYPGDLRHWPSVPDWSEGPDDVGSHDAFTVAGTLYAGTMEQLYAECHQVLSGDPIKATLVLNIDEAGIPVRCTQRFINCADDCEWGIFLAGNPAVICQALNACATAGCPESGPARYHGCDVTTCSDQPACGSLPDGTSCGAGVCGQGTCLNTADEGSDSSPADGSGGDARFGPDASNNALVLKPDGRSCRAGST